jgi:hypothetical protein
VTAEDAKIAGKPVTMHSFVDANHAGNIVTRRSHTGILMFIQNSPFLWLSRRQNTVEASKFGSEFVAMRTARDLYISMRYKLQMFGVPLDGPALTIRGLSRILVFRSQYYPRNTMQ